MPRACSIVPPYLLRHLAEREEDGVCAHTLDLDRRFRHRRATPARWAAPTGTAPAGAAWTVHDAGNAETLPGEPVRSAGDPGTGDAAVDEAAAGITAALAHFREVHGRDSYDGAGHPVSLTVHFGRDYVNAFWDGAQLVFGDGDGRVFERFTKPVDVLAHEFTHAVVEHTAALEYAGQPGALNESVSDVFASCLKQRLLGQTAAEADWLIGEELFRPGIQARGLRDLARPGTAYDDPAIGRDPQVGHLRDYVVTSDDNGGVHLNSGIPNRAFHLAAVGIGGRTWEGAGPVWYAALTGGAVGRRTDFAGFAAATVAAAGQHAEVVREAWAQVGVGADAAEGPGAPDAGRPAPAVGVVRVRRSGGVVGRVVESSFDLGSADPRAEEVGALLRRVRGLAPPTEEPAQPDRFRYEFDLDGEAVTVAEQHLTPDLRRLADLVLG